MTTKDEAEAIAQRVMRLINSQPSSPTFDQLLETIGMVDSRPAVSAVAVRNDLRWRAHAVHQMVAEFEAARDPETGQRLYPRFEELRIKMGRLLESDEALVLMPETAEKLRLAYEMATRGMPPGGSS